MVKPLTLALALAALPGVAEARTPNAKSQEARIQELADLVAYKPESSGPNRKRTTRSDAATADLGAFLARVAPPADAAPGESHRGAGGGKAASAGHASGGGSAALASDLVQALDAREASPSVKGEAATGSAARSEGAPLDTLLGSARGAEPSGVGAIGWMLGLAVLGVISFVIATRGRNVPLRNMRVLEQTTVGKGRSLLLVEVGGQNFLLAASEAGIHVIGQPKGAGGLGTAGSLGGWGSAGLGALGSGAAGNASAALASAGLVASPREGLLGTLSRLTGARSAPAAAAPAEPAFSGELARCMEDLELRQKLAAAAAKRGNDGPH